MQALRRSVLVSAVCVALAMSVPGPALAAPARASLPGNTPAWASTRNFVKAAPAADHIGFRVYLAWRNPDAAAAYAKAVSDPLSPSYGRYLTPEQFRARFSPTFAQVKQVRDWLVSQGFSAGYVPDNNHYVTATGTLAKAQTAFSTGFGLYRVQGRTLRSPRSAVTVPDSLGSLVVGVVGLDQSAQLLHPDHIVDAPALDPAPGFRNADPLATYYGELPSPYTFPEGFTDRAGTAPWVVRGYTPQQVKSAYQIQGGYDGSGQTVAVIDAFASPTILADANEWSHRRGLPAFRRGQFSQVIAPGAYQLDGKEDQDPQGWWGEETLDIEAVHGMAPGAKVVYVGASDANEGLDAAMNHAVDRKLASIITNSYGWAGEDVPKREVRMLNDTFIQAACQGIGIYFSSGDDGDESANLGTASADFPASSPWVTAVGGTSLAVDAHGARQFETGWGTSSWELDASDPTSHTSDGWMYGAGGGFSTLYAEPWYQQRAGLAYSGRAVPDVAALGDPQTGLLMGQTQGFSDGTYYDEYRIGGTSLSSPIFAGLMALAQQKAHRALGFANPAIYLKAGSFADVTPLKTAVARRNFVNSENDADGTYDVMRTFDDYSGSPVQFTAVGWDDVTGWGAPKGIFQP